MTCSKCKNEAPALVGTECWACANPRPEHDDPAHWIKSRSLERGIDSKAGSADNKSVQSEKGA